MNRDVVPPRHLSTTWGDRTIGFTLFVEVRPDLVITVHPDLRVHVRAPDDKSLASVLDRVRARRSWIARQLGEFEQMAPIPPPRFVSGETIFYLGREYRLRVERGQSHVSLHSGRLHIRLPGTQSRAVIRRFVLEWFRQRSHEVFGRRLSRVRQESPILRLLEPVVKVRLMTQRWGSCSSRGVITLNPTLIQTPPACIDYVLAHELVHLLEPSHSTRFYRLLDRVMPSWRERRHRLARAAVRWH
jgi:predicted metal-dependent hydrolase